MVLGEALEPKPGLQEAPRGPKTAKNQPCKIQEIRFSECQWAEQYFRLAELCQTLAFLADGFWGKSYCRQDDQPQSGPARVTQRPPKSQ